MDSTIILPEWYAGRPYASAHYQRIAAWALQHHPFYRKHAPAPGEPFPVLTRAALQADNELLLAGQRETARSSGSTSTPVRICWGEQRARREQRDQQRLLGWLGGALPASRIVSTAAHAADERTLEVSTEVAEQVQFLLRRWREHGACALVTYPTNLEMLCLHILGHGLDFSFMRRVTCLSETYEDAHDELLRLAFPAAQACVTYSAVETGLIAARCPHRPQYYHLMADKLGVEILDDDDRPCRDGELGRVVVTDYCNRATPMIRYALGDYAAAASCDCGRIGGPALTDVVGKQQGVFHGRDGRRFIFTRFSPMFRDSPEIAQYQVLQDDLDRFTVRCVPRPGADLAPFRQRVQQRFEQEFGVGVRIDYEILAAIPRSPGGKFQVAICRLPQA